MEKKTLAMGGILIRRQCEANYFSNSPAYSSTVIPWSVLRMNDISPQAFKTYGVMLSFMDQGTHKIEITRAHLALYLELSQVSLDKHLKELVDLGLLHVERHGLMAKNDYYAKYITKERVEKYDERQLEFIARTGNDFGEC